MYQSIVRSKGNPKKYIGIAKGLWKQRSYSKYGDNTTFSKHVWNHTSTNQYTTRITWKIRTTTA